MVARTCVCVTPAAAEGYDLMGSSVSEDKDSAVLCFCSRDVKVKVICDRFRVRGVLWEASDPWLWGFSLPLRGKSISSYVTEHFLPRTHSEEEAGHNAGF